MVVIDFTKDNMLLEESILRALGSWTKSILRHMYGKDVKMVGDINSISQLASLIKEDDEPNFKIKGKYRDVKSYASAIVRQKEHIDSYLEYGAEHPNTAKTRVNLQSAISEFQAATGLKWPFKVGG